MIFVICTIVALTSAASTSIGDYPALYTCGSDPAEWVCPTETNGVWFATHCCDAVSETEADAECQQTTRCIQGSTTSNQAFVYPVDSTNGNGDFTGTNQDCDFESDDECEQFEGNVDLDEILQKTIILSSDDDEDDDDTADDDDTERRNLRRRGGGKDEQTYEFGLEDVTGDV